MMTQKSEIHMHSTYSDGEFSPAELVQIAKRNGVSILSLTDHDTFDGIEEFLQEAEAAGITAFPGIEITTRFRDFNIHLLGYFQSTEVISTTLRERVREMTDLRETRMRELIDRINQVVPDRFQGTIQMENVKRGTEGVLARPHLAREMLRLKIVSSVNEAFDRYLVKYNIEKRNLEAETALRLIRESGGVPVLAHPGERTYSIYNPDGGRDKAGVPGMLDELKSMGLLGLECIYPYHEKMGRVDYFVELAEKFDLIVTGSRDFHGFTTSQKPAVLGTTRLNDGFLQRFQETWAQPPEIHAA